MTFSKIEEPAKCLPGSSERLKERADGCEDLLDFVLNDLPEEAVGDAVDGQVSS